jgi:hypothetical protein
VPTTDIRLARLVLEQCATAGFRFALLHPLPDVPDGDAISDLDVVWETPIDRVTLRGISERVLTPLGLQLVVAWPYDVGAVSVFALNRTGHQGVHLDLVHDAAGLGRLGIRYSKLLERSMVTRTAPLIDEVDRLIYLARKRQWKGQREELAGVIAALREVEDQAEVRMADFLAGPAQRDVRELLDGKDAPGRFRRRPSTSPQAVGRVRRRLRYPVGVWVHLDGATEAVAEELSKRFSRTVAHSCAVRIEGSQTEMARDLLTKIAPVRWRAGVVFSHGARPSMASPDVVVAAARRSINEVAGDVIDQLVARPGLLSSIAS